MLRYSTNIYQSSATILIQNAKENDVLSGLNANTGISLFPERLAIGNEIALFKTPTILRGVAAQLELNKTYRMVGQNAGIKKSEMWGNNPIALNAVGADSLLFGLGAEFQLKVLSANRYELTMNQTEYLGKHNFNAPIATTIGTISFDKTPNFGGACVGNTYLIGLSPLESVASGLNGAIIIDRADKTSDLIAISIQGPVVEKNNAIYLDLPPAPALPPAPGRPPAPPWISSSSGWSPWGAVRCPQATCSRDTWSGSAGPRKPTARQK